MAVRRGKNVYLGTRDKLSDGTRSQLGQACGENARCGNAESWRRVFYGLGDRARMRAKTENAKRKDT